jgi:hypothetical protein
MVVNGWKTSTIKRLSALCEPAGSGAAGSIHEPVCEGRCTGLLDAAKPMIVAHSGFSRKQQM